MLNIPSKKEIITMLLQLIFFTVVPSSITCFIIILLFLILQDNYNYLCLIMVLCINVKKISLRQFQTWYLTILFFFIICIIFVFGIICFVYFFAIFLCTSFHCFSFLSVLLRYNLILKGLILNFYIKLTCLHAVY